MFGQKAYSASQGRLSAAPLRGTVRKYSWRSRELWPSTGATPPHTHSHTLTVKLSSLHLLLPAPSWPNATGTEREGIMGPQPGPSSPEAAGALRSRPRTQTQSRPWSLHEEGSRFCPGAFPGPRQPLCRPRLQDTLSPDLWSRPPRRWVSCRRAWGQLLIPTVSRLSQGTLAYQICPQQAPRNSGPHPGSRLEEGDQVWGGGVGSSCLGNPEGRENAEFSLGSA